jgi:hypothetical protein
MMWASGVPSNISQAPPASRLFGSPTCSDLDAGHSRQRGVGGRGGRRRLPMYTGHGEENEDTKRGGG